MFSAHRYVPAMIATSMLLVSAACAPAGYRYPSPAYGVDDRAYRNGYREGRSDGEKDGRSGHRFDYARHGDYRDADDGYQYGDKRAYRTEFRRGFVDGYGAGYRVYSAPAYPGTGPYPNGRVRYPASSGSPAWQNGYRDGYEQGRDDSHDGDRFDPVKSSRYRSGDHDYDRRYGSRDDYRRDYRAAFQQGYDRGYRESR